MAAKSGGKTSFCENSPVDSADTLGVKNFVKITLSHSVSEINTFLRENVFWRKFVSTLSRYPVGQKFCQNRSISLRFRDKHIFAFNPEIQDGRQKWRERFFCEKLTVYFAETLWVKNFVEIALPRSVSEINAFLFFQR